MHSNIKRLFETGLHNVKPGLDRIGRLLQLFGNPQNSYRSIIVGGTNGKCSTATAISRILEVNNIDTGLYTSPHLTDVTERISLNSSFISREVLDSLLGEIFVVSEKNKIELSYFELLTAAAFIYFKRKNVDVAVLEVGLGGRWDATNIVNPLVSIITNVSFDHMEYLGDTIHKIASEKAGIIKENGFVLTAATGDALDTIIRVSEARNCRLYVTSENKNFSKNDGLNFRYHGEKWKNFDINTSLRGIHQHYNLVLAINCIEILNIYFNYDIKQQSVLNALSDLSVEGRFEYARVNPPLILDGAHNVAAAEVLVRSLSSIHTESKFVFLISMLTDKDHERFLEVISTKASRIILTEIPDARCAAKDILLGKVPKDFENIEIENDPYHAYKKLLNTGEPACITGSLYLIGYLKEMVKSEDNRPGIR